MGLCCPVVLDRQPSVGSCLYFSMKEQWMDQLLARIVVSSTSARFPQRVESVSDTTQHKRQLDFPFRHRLLYPPLRWSCSLSTFTSPIIIVRSLVAVSAFFFLPWCCWCCCGCGCFSYYQTHPFLHSQPSLCLVKEKKEKKKMAPETGQPGTCVAKVELKCPPSTISVCRYK